MPKTHLVLEEYQRLTLEEMRDHHPKPYMRERAAALLKLADGASIAAIARAGLLRRRQWDTVYTWLVRYQLWGIAGLTIQPGRGRKPMFYPLDLESARTQIAWVLRQSPRAYGLPQTRWRLQDVKRVLAWLDNRSEPAIYKLLKRLGFSRKQALNFIHSPDPHFHAKWKAILQAFQDAVEHPDEAVLLFQDELTYYRQPSKAPAYVPSGTGSQPRARQRPGANTQTRVAAVVNGVTGCVTYVQRSRVGKEALAAFYAQIRAAYPEAKRIYLVQDCWPTHQSPLVLAAANTHRLTPLFLPTYASWLNPIEKLWRWLKQEVLHLHNLADDLERLRQLVCDFLDRFAQGSEALLRYIGLLD
ncbi:MAG: IS630 family transposase [Anaerolineae bacterium]|nr:IS630 family transposase [Anaerolineae bacterium]